MENNYFIKAQPVWAVGKDKELNSICIFCTAFERGENIKLNITANSFYRVYLNGDFLGYGPARAAHGYARVDCYNLENLLENNVIFVEVAGYNCNSFYSLNTSAFFQAEVVSGDNCLRATGMDADFRCGVYHDRIRRTSRFSYQRPFAESYNFASNPAEQQFRCNFADTQTEIVEKVKLLPRNVGYPNYTQNCFELCERGSFEFCGEIEPYRDRYMTIAALKIFDLTELDSFPNDYISRLKYSLGSGEKLINIVKGGEYIVLQTDNSCTGFIQIDFRANADSKFFIIFDEVDFRENIVDSEPRNISFMRNTSNNIIEYTVKAGEYQHMSFEPYTAKFIKIIVERGEVDVSQVSMLAYENSDVREFLFATSDSRLNLIVDAAVRTFVHNAVDILTDCPSRERAGWLCDSYFTAQAEKLFTGRNLVENNFLENYQHAPQLENLPLGMIGMCYPADFGECLFISNWSLWYLIELQHNYLRTGDRTIADSSREKVNGLLKYFDKLLNSDGLIENQENWIFVEWSMANDSSFVEGVNYPSNMLYAQALQCVGELYSDEKLVRKAQTIRNVIRKQSYNGEFFEDNRIRQDGKLIATGNTSETCQYFAFYFDIATPLTHGELWQKLVDDFGPNRDIDKVYPKVFKSNAFIGNYLRLDYLNRWNMSEQVVNESVDYFYKMAVTTGTLWEHDKISGSLDHGFAAYIANLIIKCVTGYRYVDNLAKVIYFSPCNSTIDCKVAIPISDSLTAVLKRTNGETTFVAPIGYTVKSVKNLVK